MKRLNTKWLGKNLYEYDEIASTNTEASHLAAEGICHGTMITAKKQSAGKGRRGRSWETLDGNNIYMSILLRPRFTPDKAPMLTLVMAYSAANAMQEAEGIEAQIKWPNDLVIGKKKICGILTEMKLDGENISHVIIGVGINANIEHFPEEIANRATSLKQKTGRETDCEALICKIAEHFETDYEKFLECEDLSFLQEEYNRMLVNKDRQVRILEPGNEYEAVAHGINSAGEPWCKEKMEKWKPYFQERFP